MRVPYDEGVANHIGPEFMRGCCEGISEALTGSVQAKLLSRENDLISGAACRPTSRHCAPSITTSRSHGCACYSAAARRIARRGQRIAKIASDYLPQPTTLHPWPQMRFAVTHPGGSRVREFRFARFCPGGGR